MNQPQDTSPGALTRHDADVAGKKELRGRFKILLALAVFVAFLTWLAIDLYGPWSADLRRFDSNQVADFETAMWRSYYDKQPVKLFWQLGHMIRTQYHVPFFRSNIMAYQAARAAFVFKRGRGRADYQQALPYLESYFDALKRIGKLPFDTRTIAKLELEWWIIHRERDKYPPEALGNAIARVAAELYRIPPERVAEHGRLRAEAMVLRDSLAQAGLVSEADWLRITHLLRASWQSLAKAVHRGSRPLVFDRLGASRGPFWVRFLKNDFKMTSAFPT